MKTSTCRPPAAKILLLYQQVSTTLPRPAYSGRGIFLRRPVLWLAALLFLAVAIYFPGLHGPFLFDDPPNIILPINAWLSGQTGWQEVVFGNGSGLLHRPLANLSFALNAVVSGLDPAPFKATNLAIHLLCGILIYTLAAQLLTRDPYLRPRARMAALVVAAVWLLHPIHVSTVLYVVQRMAQMSALFVLLALLAFVQGRLAFEVGRTRAGLTWLFIALPTATLAAVLSKENGALVPLLCAVIELGYFCASSSSPRPGSVKLFFAASLVLPAAAALLWYGLHFDSLLAGYEGRLYTLGERLLTQPRVLVDYLGALLLPSGPSLGVYTDDFAVSRSFMNPSSTPLAIGGLIGLIAAALWSRTRIPAFFTGIGLFLAGHAMESSIFPLEMHFEHRNYLPSFGLFLALVGLYGWLQPHLLKRSDNPVRLQKLLGTGLIMLLAVLAAATFARAGVWRSWHLLAEQGVRQHPQSMRAHLDHANLLQLQGRHAEAQQVFEHMTTMDNPAARHAGIIDSVTLQCMVHGTTNPGSVARLGTIAGAKLQLAEMLAFENLGNYLQKNRCGHLSKSKLAEIIVQTVNAAPQPERLTQLWRSRFVASQLYATGGQLALAQQQAALAWITGAADNAVGVYLTQMYLANGDIASARLVLGDVRKHLAPWDQRNHKLVAKLELKLGDARQTPTRVTPVEDPPAS